MADFVRSFLLLTILAHGTMSAPFQDVAKNVKSQMILVDNPNAISVDSSSLFENNQKLTIPSAAGQALDLFYRYGFFSLSVRVVPRNDPGSWLVREPTNSVFTPDSVLSHQEPGPSTFDPYYQVFLCDDITELLEAYFRDFKADGVPQPYKLYTGSWRKTVMARYLGLNPDSLDGDSSFVLVKLTKMNRVVKTEGKPVLKAEAQQAVSNIVIENTDSVLDFIHDYGSHYVKEIVLGEVVYQVFALTQDQYAAAKTSLGRFQRIPPGDFNKIYESFLAPWNVRETGGIKAASGDFAVQKFLEEKPKFSSKFATYPNIFEFQNDPTLMRQLEEVSTPESEAVIGLNFASLRSVVPNIENREFFDEVVNTQISLWELNISK